jgi:hypothetical protein
MTLASTIWQALGGGPVLIAVNPFKRVDMYTEELMSSYRRGTAKAGELFRTSTRPTSNRQTESVCLRFRLHILLLLLLRASV